MFFEKRGQENTNKQFNYDLPIDIAQLWYCLSPTCAPKEWYVEKDLIRTQTWIIAENDSATPYIIGSSQPVCPHCAEDLHKQE